VTRISIGVQSFQPELLEGLGRRHTRQQALRAYEAVRAAGFASVNFDLIFAIPGQTLKGWRADLDEAVSHAPDHISTYCLTFEEDTALFVKLSQGRVRPDVVTETAFYTKRGNGSKRRAMRSMRYPTLRVRATNASTT